MKKHLLVFCMLFSLTAFAAPWDVVTLKKNVSAWDKPLVKSESKFFWPWVDLIRVYKYQGGNLMLQVKLSEAWDEDLQLIVPVHTYKAFDLFPTQFQWVWIHYTIPIPHGVKSLATIISTNSYYQYNTWPDGQGNDFLDGPEFYVEYFGY